MGCGMEVASLRSAVAGDRESDLTEGRAKLSVGEDRLKRVGVGIGIAVEPRVESPMVCVANMTAVRSRNGRAVSSW